MGEVYRATDTRLDRTVAIKVLPEHLADRADLRERFEREAKAVSSLNHPHICTLHDIGEQDGIHYLVMEYVDGETLQQRLEKGRLPLDQALEYAIQIADALDKAHRQSVVHRDLKPGNIMITKSGTKLLDFGLAKLKGDAAEVSPLSQMPTQDAPAPLTAEGTILGTLQYMAPEQLEGKEADSRTDIFAFGTVVYEMVTAKKAFQGASQASLIGAILRDDPQPMSELQTMTPPSLDHIVTTCLDKDPDMRWQAASDLVRELKWCVEGGSLVGAPAPVTSRRKHRERLWIGTTVLLTALTILLAVGRFFQPESTEFGRIEFLLATQAIFDFAVSPDGRHVVVQGVGPDGSNMLWLRSLDSRELRALTGITTQFPQPFWSPDSRSIGFFAEQKLKKIDIGGGPVQTLCDVADPKGASWNEQGLIVFASRGESGRTTLYSVSSAGGVPTPVTTLNDASSELGHGFPEFLPDGRRFLYQVRASDPEQAGVYLGSLDSEERSRLLATNLPARYAMGHLLFVQDGSLMAQSFNVSDASIKGEAFPLIEEILVNRSFGRAAFSASANGVLASRSSDFTANRLVWFDRSGNRLESFEKDNAAEPRLSPDEKQIALSEGGDIWILDLERGFSTGFTYDQAADDFPVWSPDGATIVFASDRDGGSNLYQKPASGAGEPELLFEGCAAPTSWSLDGRFLLCSTTQTGPDLIILPLFGTREPIPFRQTESWEFWGQFSPDGEWIAYGSNESGSMQIYLRPFPGTEIEGQWQVSTDGGGYPMWRRDGKELYYHTDRKVMAVDVVLDPIPEFSSPRRLFDIPGGNPVGRWIVSADGQRFLFPQNDRPEGETLTVIVNWTTLLQENQ